MGIVGEVLVEGFFDRVRIAPGVLGALRETGDLERMVRAELEPFYSSPEVAAPLDET